MHLPQISIYRQVFRCFAVSVSCQILNCIHCGSRQVSQNIRMSERRWFENPYADYAPNKDRTVSENGELHPLFLEKMRNISASLLEKLNNSLKDLGRDDFSIYTGTTGIGLLYYLVGTRQNNSEYLSTAVHILEKSLAKLKHRRVTFLNGDAGPFAFGAVLYHQIGKDDEAHSLVRRLEDMLPSVLSTRSDLPDEVLYGRAGYLYALLFVNKHIGSNTIDSSVIQEVVSAILNSGQKLAKQERRSVPLMYMWHEKYYLGAAHGISGILYMLLQARRHMSKSDLQTLVKPTIDFLQDQRFSSGNFLSSLGSTSDRLVQWCHGAPGMVDLFVLAYQVFKDKKYLETAVRCGEVVWKNGILTKSYSICHGTSGNTYTFLTLYQATKDPKYLHRACKFAEWCTDYGKHQTRIPDRPLSLFEGLAGAIYLMVDIQEPSKALFPAYAL